jgi:hypothetical protein
MKRFLRLGLAVALVVVMLLAIFPASSVLAEGEERFDYLNVGDDTAGDMHSILYYGQTFTPDVSYSIEYVKVKTYRTGSPGTVTMRVRATDGEGLPTGGDLCIGTTDANAWATDTAGTWYQINIVDGDVLVADETYAIIISLGGNSSNYVGWRMDGDDNGNGYTIGQRVYSSNSGGSWTGAPPYDGQDYMFEIWGIGQGVEVPEARTDEATGVQYNEGIQWFEATLNGYCVDDGGEACSAWFEYRVEGSGESGWKLCVGVGDVVTDEAFDFGLINLLSETTYDFRASVINSEDIHYGEILQFNTGWVVSLPIVITYGYPIILGEEECRIYGGIGCDGGSLCDAWFEWREIGEENWEEVSATNFMSNSGFEEALGEEWVQSGGGTMVRSDEQAKSGGCSLKVTYVSGGVQGLQNIEEYERLRTVKVSLGAWVLASEANAGRLQIYDGGDTAHSAYHTGSGEWEWLSVNKIVRGVATRVYGGLVTAVDAIVYFDDIAFVKGATVSSSGEYGELLETGEGANKLLTGLDMITWYEFRLLAENDEGVGSGGIGSFVLYGEIGEPTVRTDGTMFLENTSVRLCGTLVDDAEGPGCIVGFEWRKVGSGTWNNTGNCGCLTSGEEWTKGIDNLLPETNYEYRAWARHSIIHSEEVYGEIKVIYTEKTFRTPTMSTSRAEYYDSTTFYLTGACTYDGGSEVDAWFQYRLLGDAGWYETEITTGLTTGYEWSKLVYNLVPEFYYEYRAVGENDLGFGFGEVEQFYMDAPTVDPPPVPFDPVGGIDRWLARFGLNNEGGHWMLLLVLMGASFAIFYKINAVLRVVFPLVIFAIAIAVGWVSIWIVILLALGAGVTAFTILRKQVAGGG